MDDISCFELKSMLKKIIGNVKQFNELTSEIKSLNEKIRNADSEYNAFFALAKVSLQMII